MHLHDLMSTHTAKDNEGIYESESLESLSSSSLAHHHLSQTVEKDLIMVHLLRLVCASKGTLADSLPQVATELYNLGIFSDWARDMASKSPSLFNKTFDHVFQKHLVGNPIIVH